MPRNEQALQAVAEQAAAVLAASGFPTMPGRVLMALLIAPAGGRTAEELRQSLGVSAAAISGAVRYLQTVGIIHRIAQPGSRRARWEMFDDTWYHALARGSSVYSKIAMVADQAVAAIDDPDAVESRRAQDMARFFRFVDVRIGALMAEWEQERQRFADEDGAAAAGRQD